MKRWWMSLRLGTRAILATMLVLAAVLVVNYTVFGRAHHGSATQAMVERAKAFTAVADEAKNHAAKLHQQNVFEKEALVTEVKQAMAAGKPYADTRIFKTIPVVVGWSAALEASQREHIDFQIVAEKARNAKHKPADGTFRARLLADLTQQVNAGGDEMIHRVDPATNQLHFMRAIRLTSDCLSCHGAPGGPDDPDKDGKDVLGFAMEGWKTGDMHGAYEVAMPLAPVEAEVRGFVVQGLLWTVPLALGAVVLLVWMFRAMLSKPLAMLIGRIQEIEKTNDLTLRVKMKGTDEIGVLGNSFNGLVGTLHDIIAKVGASANEVAGAATEIAASSEEMAAGMKEQTSQVVQISAAVEEMSASIVEVARKSADAAGSAEQSGKSAEQGGTVVIQTIEGMKNINEAVRASAASVQELGSRGQEIGRIIQVINDIADQTNLLALNAAIEAARAGEHGRGFAVVADEVRKLADRTTQATKEIGTSIKAIQTETGQAVKRMESGTRQVEQGVELATQAGASLQEIVNSAKTVASMIQSIAAAAEEQSSASEQVSRNVESISSVTRQTNEGAGQAAQAAAELSRKAEELQRLVGRFKTGPVSKAA